MDAGLGQDDLGDSRLEASAGVSPPDHLPDEADVTFGVAPVTTVPTVGLREPVPGLPHPERGGHQTRPFGKVADRQTRLDGRSGRACGLRSRVHPVIVNLNNVLRKVFNYF